MLKKVNRLTSFSLPNPKIIQTPLFNLKISRNNSEYTRIGFIISKKVASSAVVRNSTKRKFRSIIEEKIDLIDVGYDLAFYLRKDLLESDRTKTDHILTDILKKEQIYHE